MPARTVGVLTGMLLLAGPAAMRAQADLSLGLGLGTVRFPGGATLGVMTIGPALELAGAGREISVGTNFASLPSGNSYLQGRIGAWLATAPSSDHWRLAMDAHLSGATRGSGTASGSGQLGVEGLRATSTGGVGIGIGPASGWIVGAAPVTAWRGRLRGWWQPRPRSLGFVASIEPTRFLGSWFTDVAAGGIVQRGALQAQLSASARLSQAFGSKGAAIASAEYRLSRYVSFEAVGGNVLPDPYQGLPASGFVAAGVRVHFPLRSKPPDGLVQSRSVRATRRGDAIVVRVQQRHAAVVTIAGDWTGWTPVPMARVDGDQWEIVAHIPRGSHHFTVIVDGSPWRIPDDVPSVPDGMGGWVAVLSVF